MFTPFVKEDNVLNENPFMKHEVQFNLMHRIIEGDLDVALKISNDKAIALSNFGRAMWLWVNKELEQGTIDNIVDMISENVSNRKIQGIAADPRVAKQFAEKYSKNCGITYKKSMGLQSYYCTEVIKTRSNKGKMMLSKNTHTHQIAKYCVDFILDGYGQEVTVESQLSGAEQLINSGNLYLWSVDSDIVTMAHVTHRSVRHARINYVYTPPQRRKNGYASALVAELSLLLLNEGLTPMLYADLKNPQSNKVYKNIGYKEAGKIEQYDFAY